MPEQTTRPPTTDVERQSAPAASLSPERGQQTPYLRAVSRQWLVILGCTVVALAAAGGYLASVGRVYRAESRVVVGQGGSAIPSQFSSGSQGFSQTMAALVHTDVVARDAIAEGDLSVSTTKLLDRLHVTNAPEAAVLELSYDDTSRAGAVATLAAVSKVYVDIVERNLNDSTDPANRVSAVVFDPAHALSGAVRPRPLIVLALALILGLGVGGLLAALRASARP